MIFINRFCTLCRSDVWFNECVAHCNCFEIPIKELEKTENFTEYWVEPEQPSTEKWVVATERLPQKDQDVIVLVDYLPYARVYKFRKGVFYGFGKPDKHVTHWIPLPEKG